MLIRTQLLDFRFDGCCSIEDPSEIFRGDSDVRNINVNPKNYEERHLEVNVYLNVIILHLDDAKVKFNFLTSKDMELSIGVMKAIFEIERVERNENLPPILLIGREFLGRIKNTNFILSRYDSSLSKHTISIRKAGIVVYFSDDTIHIEENSKSSFYQVKKEVITAVAEGNIHFSKIVEVSLRMILSGGDVSREIFDIGKL